MAKIISAAEAPLNESAGIVRIESGDQVDSDGVVMDIKMLKLAILYIQKKEPGILSIKFRKAKHSSGIEYFLISTKKQEEAGQNEAFILSPLTTHVDQADKFKDTEDKIFLEDIATPVTSTSENGNAWFVETLPVERERKPRSPLNSPVEIQDPSAVKPKKRGRPKKVG